MFALFVFLINPLTSNSGIEMEQSSNAGNSSRVSYLHNRMQFVSIDGTDSETRHMQYGVPQGSILGSLFFIIYINDIPNVSQIAKFILYADDANIIITGLILLKSMRSYVICVKFSSNGLTLMASAQTLRKLNI